MGVYTGTVPTFLAGELPDADKFIEITNYMTASTSAWTTYTVTWSGGAGVSLGNGTLVGKYRQLGKTVQVKIKLVAGSTTTFGSTVWSFSLPVTALSTSVEVGSLYMLDSGTANRSGSCLLNTTTTLFCITSADTDVGPSTPQAWANGDALVACITYEAA
jgi:hypothetical protein